jgi:hypothetical protein
MLHISHSKNYEWECADNASNIYVGTVTAKARWKSEILNCAGMKRGIGESEFSTLIFSVWYGMEGNLLHCRL